MRKVHPFLICSIGFVAFFGVAAIAVSFITPYFEAGLRDKEFQKGVPLPVYASLRQEVGGIVSDEWTSTEVDGLAHYLSPIIDAKVVKFAQFVAETEVEVTVKGYSNSEFVEEGKLSKIEEYYGYRFEYYNVHIDQVEFIFDASSLDSFNLIVSGVSRDA